MHFEQAKFFTQASRGPNDIEGIVVHTAEMDEGEGQARALGRFFANLPDSTPPAKRVSSHYGVDVSEIVQYVRDEDIANHALGYNSPSLGYELCARAGQSHEKWRDENSRKMIDLAAKSMAADCKRYGIPVRHLSADELKDGKHGIVSHKTVSDVFGEGIRSDPGAEFPWGFLLQRIEVHLGNMEKIVYFLSDEANTRELAHSAAVEANKPAARRDRLDRFLNANIELLDAETNEDRDVVLRRRKAD